MPYELRSTDGRFVVSIDDLEAHQMAGAIDRLNSPNEDGAEPAPLDADELKIIRCLFKKLKGMNLGEYFFENEEVVIDDYQTRVYLAQGSIEALAHGQPIEIASVIIWPI
jgi:hypothetical protein